MAPQQGSPAVARWRVRLALRKAREAKGLTQGEVADEIGWSLSKVQRIEAGDVSVSGTDLRAMLDLFGVTDPAVITKLQEDARVSRRQRWLTSPEHREALTPGHLELLQFEAEATTIRSFQSFVFPGPTQTRAYANALIGFFNESLSEDERRVRLDVRMQRGKLFDRPGGPTYLALLDESALHREIGGLDVMAEQLDHLVDLARRPQVQIRILPFREGGLLGIVGAFTLLNLGSDDPGDAVLYRERFRRDSVEHDEREILEHREMFERAWKRALGEDESIRAMVAVAAELRARKDRR